jgi:hypothetical protein
MGVLFSSVWRLRVLPLGCRVLVLGMLSLGQVVMTPGSGAV